nr:MAG TPA: hypothetical protein [Caudoviricetes sp.]
MKNKRVITGVCVSVYVAMLVIGYFVEKKSLNNLYLISQIIASIIVVSGLIVSVLQYIDTSLSNTDIRKREKKVKAAEMAKNFQDDLLPLMNVLSRAYSDAKLNDKVLGKIKSANIKMFNREEVSKIFSDEEIADIITNLHGAYLFRFYEPESKKTDPKTGKVSSLNYKKSDIDHSSDEMAKTITALANGLEYFSINFNSGIADDNTVYQSLHEVFFECVYMVYLFAFRNNVTESDRLFSNMSSLYIRWKEKHDQLANDEEAAIAHMKSSVKDRIVVSPKK